VSRYASVLTALRTWAQLRDDVQAVAVVGSHARGTAREDSDIDVIVLTRDPDKYLDDPRWLDAFGTVRSVTREDWGAIRALRTFYDDGTEIEFGIGTPDWASIAPVDSGTLEVARGGMLVVFERHRLLRILESAIRSAG